MHRAGARPPPVRAEPAWWRSGGPRHRDPLHRRPRRLPPVVHPLDAAQSLDRAGGVDTLTPCGEPVDPGPQSDPPRLDQSAWARLRLGADGTRGIREGVSEAPMVLSPVSQPPRFAAVLPDRDVVEEELPADRAGSVAEMARPRLRQR